jgi:hypothetical protein
MKLKVQIAYEEVSSELNKLSKLFNPECKLAFVMWTPGKPEQCMVIGDEPLCEAGETIIRIATTPQENP